MKYIYLLLLCLVVNLAQAQKPSTSLQATNQTSAANDQRLTRDYQNQSLSKVLEDLNAATAGKTLFFIYDEMEDFTVTAHFTDLPIEEALREVIGFYPMRVNYDANKIFIECTQKETTKVIGRVIDEKGLPIEFANIALLQPGDSTFINGGVSNENGDFVIPCSRQSVVMKLSCIGYKTERRNVSVGEVGAIALRPEAYMLGGVEVKGMVPQYKMTSGGMTVEVQHSILHDIGSADDLLPLLPLVQGRDGKYEVLAKGEPEIYINNKKVRDARELKQLKSSDIKSVDIITAPGAKYNAEVNAVISIKTLKPQGDGFSLMATTQTWKNTKWNNNDDLTVKYRSGGLEAFATLALDNGHYSNDQNLDQQLHISKDLFDIHAEFPTRSSWTQMNYRAGLSYDFSTDHSIGLSYSTEHIYYGKFGTKMQQSYLKNGAYYGDVMLETNIRQPNKPVWELNTYYVGRAGKLGIDLNATLLRKDSKEENSQNEVSQELGSRTLYTETTDKNRMLAGKLVLDYPVWKGVLSGGSEVTSSKIHGHNLNNEGIIPESDTEMKEQNVAAFAEYQLMLGAWRLNAGMRYEHVSTDYSTFGVHQSEPSRTYNDLFPNLSAAWQKGKLGTQLSYSKRITRPPYNILSSLVIYDSRMLYEGGNPLLRPSIRQNLDLNVTYSWLTFVAGYTRENDFYTHVGNIYDEKNEIAIIQPDNFDHQDRVSATIVLSPKLGFWQPQATLHYYQQMFDAEKYGAPKKLNKPEFSCELQSWFVINAETKALVHLSYTGANHWGFMYRGENFMLNARVQKSFLKGQLTAALYANDILRTVKNRVKVYYAIGQTSQNDYVYTQQVGLTLSYNFNVSGSKYKGTGAGNEEKGRM